MNQNKTIFLDRDSVINQDKNYVYHIEGVFDACLAFMETGYKIVIITNQHLKPKNGHPPSINKNTI